MAKVEVEKYECVGCNENYTPSGSIQGGRIRLNGLDVLSLSERDLCKIRGGQVAYIFQEPMSSFNPVCTIEYQIKEALRLHQGKDFKAACNRAA